MQWIANHPILTIFAVLFVLYWVAAIAIAVKRPRINFVKNAKRNKK